jgi:hypothetical protein
MQRRKKGRCNRRLRELTAALRVERRGTPLRVTLGVLSLCFGVLLGTFLILITTDILSAAFLVAPFLLGGVIALAVQKL